MTAPPEKKMIAKRDGGIGHVVFNNPERHNAVSLAMWDTLDEILKDYETDDDIRVVVLSGAGGKAFVSGADISKFEEERSSKEAVERYNSRLKVIYNRIEGFKKPTIAMINGHCIGGGLNLAVCCDLRYASNNAKFGMPAAKLALGYPFHAIERLMRAIGQAAAKELMFTAKTIDAATAQNLGFVQAITAPEDLDAHVTEIAGHIAANAPLTIKAMKFIATQVPLSDAERDLDQCNDLIATCFASKDYIEGRKAFLEKRKPRFKGL